MSSTSPPPRLVQSVEELRSNLRTFDELRRDRSHPQHYAYLGFVQRGHCLLPYRLSDDVAFAPSRLIGYVDNSLERHASNGIKDGRDTDLALTRLIGQSYSESADLEHAYHSFCAAAGISVQQRRRKYWPILEVESRPDKQPPPAITVFTVGKLYSRRDVASLIGLTYSKGGNWDTGYARVEDAFFAFVNVGIKGRTGHDYPNRWDGGRLLWSAKTGTNLAQSRMKSMLSGEHAVHVFWRGSDDARFTYAGLAMAVEVEDVSPVRVCWAFNLDMPAQSDAQSADANFRRGPPPVTGERSSVYADGPTMVYLLELVGPIEAAFPDLAIGQRVVKIGISKDPARRVDDLSCGLPRGCLLQWRIRATLRFASAREAFDRETALLERLRINGWSLGGEFGTLTDTELLLFDKLT